MRTLLSRISVPIIAVLVGGALPAAFRLLDTKVSTTGVVIQRLERAGPVRYGSFALEEEGASR